MSCWQIMSTDEIREKRKELMKDYPDSTREVNAKPFGSETGLEFAKICMMEEDGWCQDFRLIPSVMEEMPGLVSMSAKSFEALDTGRRITWPALIAGCILAPHPGTARVFLADLLMQESLNPPEALITTMSVVKLYPNGFWREEVLAKIVDSFMKTGVHPFSLVYGINQMDAAEVWGGGVRSDDWEWPLG